MLNMHFVGVCMLRLNLRIWEFYAPTDALKKILQISMKNICIYLLINQNYYLHWIYKYSEEMHIERVYIYACLCRCACVFISDFIIKKLFCIASVLLKSEHFAQFRVRCPQDFSCVWTVKCFIKDQLCKSWSVCSSWTWVLLLKMFYMLSLIVLHSHHQRTFL